MVIQITFKFKLIASWAILVNSLTLCLTVKANENVPTEEGKLWPQNYPGHLPLNNLPNLLINETGDLWSQNNSGLLHQSLASRAWGDWPRRHHHHGRQDQQDDRDYGSQWEPNEIDGQKHWWDWIFPWRKHRSQHSGGHWRWHSDRNQTGDYDTSQSSKEQKDDETGNRGDERNKFVKIRISGGPIRGVVSYLAGTNKPAFMFRGIPMAEPPIGKLRFQPLQKKGPWQQTWNATKYSPACLSNTTRTRSPQHYISEDCIYMNVFTDPKCLYGKPCPILFYIHGGGFVYDSATMFNDTQIVQKYASDGIVFMIPAYRLGVFGFLDLGNDRAVKRNLGMHDIIFALEWARKEARAFGGDPKRITVMGNSAGGSAVAYLCVSPAVTKNHFQQAIISSAVPFFTNNTNLPQSYALLEHFNCTHHQAADNNRSNLHNNKQSHLSDWEKAECLRGVDASELLRQQQINEENHLIFAGPETDSELLPARNFAALFKEWKSMPMLKMTTKWEMPNGRDESVIVHCINNCILFNYSTMGAFWKCVNNNGTFREESAITPNLCDHQVRARRPLQRQRVHGQKCQIGAGMHSSTVPVRLF